MTVFFPQGKLFNKTVLNVDDSIDFQLNSLGIAQIAEAYISIKRLQKFMLYEETVKPLPAATGKEKTNGSKSDDVSTKNITLSSLNKEVLEDDLKGNGLYKNLNEEESKEAMDDIKRKVRDINPSRECGIYLNKINAKWTLDQAENTLTDLTMKVKPGRYNLHLIYHKWNISFI